MQYHIIVFEGNDLSGKSTLKSKFERATNFRHLCVDRMFVTSIIYNDYKNRHDDLRDTLYKDLDKFIEVFNPLFVYVIADLKVQLSRFDNRGEDYIKREELRDLNSRFDFFMSKKSLQYPKNFMQVFNNEKSDLDKNILLIQNKLGDH